MPAISAAPAIESPFAAGIRLLRCAVTGMLMGLANLVPGVSGGTMVLIMGLYDEFISTIADVTRLRLSRRRIVFLAVLGGAAMLTIVSLSGPMGRLVATQKSAMYSLFIGMTLGGAPLLWKLARPINGGTLAAAVAGFGLLVVIAVTGADTDAVDKDTIRAAVEQGTLVVKADYARDVLSGVLGMSAMVLPGISGAYMLLLVGRYETILAAIAQFKDYVLSSGAEGDLAALGVIIPTAIGAVVSLLVVTNLMKWMLHRHEKVTIGFLLGILIGSVVGLWPFETGAGTSDFAIGGGMLVTGLVLTIGLSRIGGGNGNRCGNGATAGK